MSVKIAYHPYALPLSHSHHHHSHSRPRPRRQSAHELGASAAYPIVISPPAAPARAAEPEPAPEPAPWNAPQHALPLEAFSWPSMWFDVPSVSPPAPPPTLAGIFAPQYDLLDALPELDHSKTPPDSSPASLHDACTTPPQDGGGRSSSSSSSSANVVATCDVPLVAPRPLPFASPTFLQFDSLPDEDEDLSFPPYTHSRRVPASERAAQNPRKRPAPPLPPPSSSDADSALLPSISKKQRRARAEPAVFVDGGGGGGARHRVPQLCVSPRYPRYTRRKFKLRLMVALPARGSGQGQASQPGLARTRVRGTKSERACACAHDSDGVRANARTHTHDRNGGGSPQPAAGKGKAQGVVWTGLSGASRRLRQLFLYAQAFGEEKGAHALQPGASGASTTVGNAVANFIVRNIRMYRDQVREPAPQRWGWGWGRASGSSLAPRLAPRPSPLSYLVPDARSRRYEDCRYCRKDA
ncbi:hypothetical protein DFH11DRAFT_1724306 [Phellopilus nigrolimitatus]|nr:hypothetical protein DFH11DRAFT_1724306 [Phellopilus nigrolimitatus]